jgi:hypothetical protein
MGKNKVKVRKVVPYNERERNAKILNLVLEIEEIKMGHVLTSEIKGHMNEFIKNGTTYIETIDLPRYGRELIICLINDKHQQTYINFRYITENKTCEDKECEEKCCH